MKNFTKHERSVIHVAETLKGGIATYLNELIPEQEKDSISIILIVPDSQLCYLNLNEFKGVLVKTVTNRYGRLVTSLLLSLKLLYLRIVFGSVVIHLHSTFAGLFPRLFTGLYPATKVIYCPHGWSFDISTGFFQKSFYKFSEFLLSFFCDRVICISNHELDSGLRIKIPSRKLIVVSNGLRDIDFSIVSSADHIWSKAGIRKRILFIGRLDFQKGVDYFVDIMSRVDVHAYGVVVGESVVNNFTYSDLPNVSFLGWKDRDFIVDIISSADLIIVPSRWEGFGYVALEAMRQSKPVIASRVGGLVDLIVDGVNGHLVDVGNVKDFVDLIIDLSSDDLNSMGESGRLIYLEKFTAFHMSSGIRDAYL